MQKRTNPGKAGAFERQFCKDLSLWWTDQRRDDVFWRSQTSGGRATERSKKGKTTFGQYGDVAFVDPIGRPLLKLVTIELKSGYAKDTIINMMDNRRQDTKQIWEKWIQKIKSDAAKAQSHHWMIVHQRTGRIPIVCMSAKFYKDLKSIGCFESPPKSILTFQRGLAKYIQTTLSDWFDLVHPYQIRRAYED